MKPNAKRQLAAQAFDAATANSVNTTSGSLLGSFNLSGFTHILNTPAYRSEIAFVMTGDGIVHPIKNIEIFEYDASTSTVSAKINGITYPVRNVLCKDTSILTIQNHIVRWLRGAHYDALIEKLNPQPKGEEKTLIGIVAGDANELGRYLMDIRQATLRRLKRKYNMDDYIAEEVISRVQMRLAEKMLTGTWVYTDKPHTIKAYLNSCIENMAIDLLRRQKNQRDHIVSEGEIILDQDDEKGAAEGDFTSALFNSTGAIADGNLNPFGQLSQYDLLAYIKTAEDWVTESPKSPIRHLLGYAEACLKHGDDLTQAEYAEKIGMKPSTFKEYIKRGRLELEKLGIGAAALRSGFFATKPEHSSIKLAP